MSAESVLDALGDENRRSIIALLRNGGLPVGQIANNMAISRPAVSRHLRVLQGAGLVDHRPEGSSNVYFLSDVGAARARAYLEQMWGEGIARFTLTADNMPARDDGARHE